MSNGESIDCGMMRRAAEKMRRSRVGLIALLILALGWVAWRVLGVGLASHLAQIEPEAALLWHSSEPEAQLNLAESAAGMAKIPPGHGTRVRAAIRLAPLDSRGYRLLARQWERAGKLQEAAAMYSIAAERGPRDLPSAAWLTEHALSHRDYATALTHIDQMLRVQPELLLKMYPVLISMAREREAQAAFVRTLRRRPPWRDGFMSLLTGAGNSAALFGLIEQLRRSPPGLSQVELAAWLELLARDRQWGAAYLTWVQSLSAEASQRIGNVYDGGFERETSSLGFDWRYTVVPGARISQQQVTGAGGTLALRIEFEDRRVQFQNVRQLLALAPGSYQLKGRVRLDDLRSDRGLVWTLTCADDGRQLAETEPMSGRTAWRSFAVDLEVPADACGGQWLTLRVPARIAAEQRIGGVAWFDDLKISASHTTFKN